MHFLTQLAAVCLLAGCVNAIVMPPDEKDLCSLPAVTGPCRAAFPRWFYNSTSQRCESFTYGGCGGNANRFETRELCDSACPCNRCTLQRDPGPCLAIFPSYFYNVTSGKCERFIYGGCRGNDNRFQSEDDCMAQCVNRYDALNCSMIDCPELSCVFDEVTPPGSCCPVCGCPNGNGTFLLPGETIMPDCNTCQCTTTGLLICTVIACEGQPGRPGLPSAPTRTMEPPTSPTRPSGLPTMGTPPLSPRCSVEGQTYMTCGTACPPTCSKPGPVQCTLQCVPGCQCPRGTILDEDNMRCVRPQFCPRPDETCDICTLQPVTGLCEAYFPSYYWNVVTRQCEQFIYGGCGGNLNRFSDMESCRDQCACTSVNCPKGSQCKVYQPTGETFCEPSCDLDNGGCAENETCSLKNVTCVRAPCPPEVECQSLDHCLQPKESGLCLAAFRRFYYDQESGECKKFTYGGCGGNENRFLTKGRCEDVCQQTCDIKGQKFTTCGTACPPNCSNPNPICTRQCVPGCQCPQGTVLDEIKNECVRLSQCSSNMTCNIEGQEFTDCGSACPPTCSNPNPICTRQCVPGCQCPRRTVLDEKQNKCVKLSQCMCPPTCSHDYCSVRRNRRKPCSRPPPLTKPACPDQCQATQCNACYYSENSLETPSRCDRRACTGRRFTKCLRNWASCVERFNRQDNMCKDDCVKAENFQCYDYPSCENSHSLSTTYSYSRG